MNSFPLKLLFTAAGLSWVVWSYRDLSIPAFEAQAVLPAVLYVSVALLAAVLLYLVKMLRLRLWCEAHSAKRLPFWYWIERYLTSVYWGTLTPARAGDFTRIELLKALELPRTKLGLIVVVDKLADALYVAFALCLSAGVVAVRLDVAPAVSLLLAAAIAVGYLIGARVVLSTLPLAQFLMGVLLTAVAFTLFLLSNAALFSASGIELSLPDTAAIVICAGALASLPISIGGLGVREASLAALLAAWHVAPANAMLLILFELLLNVVLPIALFAGCEGVCKWRGLTLENAG